MEENGEDDDEGRKMTGRGKESVKNRVKRKGRKGKKGWKEQTGRK